MYSTDLMDQIWRQLSYHININVKSTVLYIHLYRVNVTYERPHVTLIPKAIIYNSPIDKIICEPGC